MRFGHAVTGFTRTPDGVRPGKLALALAGATDPASAVTCYFLAAARPVLFVRPDRYIADAFDLATFHDVGKRLQSLLNVNGMP